MSPRTIVVNVSGAISGVLLSLNAFLMNVETTTEISILVAISLSISVMVLIFAALGTENRKM